MNSVLGLCDFGELGPGCVDTKRRNLRIFGDFFGRLMETWFFKALPSFSLDTAAPYGGVASGVVYIFSLRNSIWYS